MPVTGPELCQYWDAKETGLHFWRPTWQEIADYTMPKRTSINRVLSPGQQNMEHVFDGTAIQANDLLAASMQGSLTSNSIKWFTLKVKGSDIKEGSDEAKWLNIAADRMYELIRYSNFQAESHEMYQDLSGLGTGAMYIEDSPSKYGRFGGIRFKAIGLGTFCIDEDFEGHAECVYRRMDLTAKQVLTKPEWKGKIATQIAATAEKEPDRRWPFLHIVRPRKLAQYGQGSLSRPYASWYVDYTHKTIMEEFGYFENPFAIPRWSKQADEEWGRGPGLTALPDTKTLNKLVELKLAMLGKVVNPPLKVRDAGVMGVVRLTPGGITHMRDMDAVQPLELGARGIEFAAMDEEKLQQKIKRYFYSDQLQMQDGPQMTAYEVQVRYELMQRLLGPTLGRIESEFQNPMIERIFNICLRAGVFPPMPQKLKDMYRQGKLDIEYEGPLARAQKFVDSLAIQRFYQIAIPVAQVDPTVMDIIDGDESMRVHANATGVPDKVLRSPEKIEEIRTTRLEAQQEANAQAARQAEAEALGKLAPYIKAVQETTAGAAGQAPSLAGRV